MPTKGAEPNPTSNRRTNSLSRRKSKLTRYSWKAWLCSCVFLAALHGAPGSEARQADKNLETLAMFTQDESCNLHSIFFHREGSFPLHYARISFYDEMDKKAVGSCLPQLNSFVPVFDANMIVTFSRVKSDDMSKKFKYEVIAVENERGMGVTTAQKNGEYHAQLLLERTGTFHIDSCFNDAQAIIYCPVTDAHKKHLYLKRFFVDPTGKDADHIFMDMPGLLPIDPKIFSGHDVLRIVFDSNTAEIFVVFRNVHGNMHNKVIAISLYGLNAPGTFVETTFNPAFLRGVSSYGGYRYALVSPKHDQFIVEAGGNIVRRPVNHYHTIYRGIYGGSVIRTEVGPHGNAADESTKVVEGMHKPVVAHMGMSKTYLENNINGIRFYHYSRYMVKCGDPIIRLKNCRKDIEIVTNQMYVAIGVAILVSLLFVCLVILMLMITVFCVKERRRRRMRAARTHRLTHTATKTKNSTTKSRTTKGSETETKATTVNDEKESFFASQMRKLAMMDDDDEHQKDEKDGSKKGSKNTNKDDDSNYVRVKENFDGAVRV